MKRRKGQTIPTNILVIIIIAVLVVAVLVVYFSGVVGVSMSQAEAETTFRQGCLTYCEKDTYETYVNAYEILSSGSPDDMKFLAACDRLGYGTRISQPGNAFDYPNRCLEFCGQNFCNMEVTPGDAESTHNQIIQGLQT